MIVFCRRFGIASCRLSLLGSAYATGCGGMPGKVLKYLKCAGGASDTVKNCTGEEKGVHIQAIR
jgi:hypothetical protein